MVAPRTESRRHRIRVRPLADRADGAGRAQVHLELPGLPTSPLAQPDRLAFEVLVPPAERGRIEARFGALDLPFRVRRYLSDPTRLRHVREQVAGHPRRTNAPAELVLSSRQLAP